MPIAILIVLLFTMLLIPFLLIVEEEDISLPTLIKPTPAAPPAAAAATATAPPPLLASSSGCTTLFATYMEPAIKLAPAAIAGMVKLLIVLIGGAGQDVKPIDNVSEAAAAAAEAVVVVVVVVAEVVVAAEGGGPSEASKHEVQAVLAANCEYVSGGQGVQSEPTTALIVPAGQLKHVKSPSLLEVPAGHASTAIAAMDT